jgi:hypothetical protein
MGERRGLVGMMMVEGGEGGDMMSSIYKREPLTFRCSKFLLKIRR